MMYPAKIIKSKPSEMTSFLASRSQIYEKGMVLVDIQELNLVNVICRYGLSVPWIQVQTGWKVWVMPTWGDSHRWVMFGIEEPGNITDNDMLIFNMPTGNLKIQVGNNTIESDGTTSLKFNGSNLEVKV